MANPYKGLTVEVDGNVTDFSRALRQAKNEAKGTTSELRELKKALKFDPQNVELLEKAQKNYQTQIKATEKQLEILKKKEEEVQKSGAEISDEAWLKLQNEIQTTTKKLERLKQESTDLKFASSIEEGRKQVQAAEKDLTRLNQSLKLDPSNVELLTSKQEALERAIEGSTKQAEALRKKQQEIGKENMSTAEWVNLQSEISDCEAKAKDFEQELKDLSRTSDKVTGELDSGMKNVGDKIQNAGSKIAGVGDAYTRSVSVPIVAAAAASVKAATDIDSALTDVRKTVDGTEEEYQELKQAAIDYSKVNAVDAAEILSLQALGAQLGFAKDELKDFAEVASGLDIATNMDAETAATEMAHFANIVGMSHDEIGNYASAIVELGNNTATTEADISAMAQRIAGAGKSIGLSNAEILGMSAALSSLGIEAEAGGTAISTLMSNVDMSVAKGTAGVQKYAEQVGMSTADFIRALNEDASQFEAFAQANGTTAENLKKEIMESVGSLETWASAAGMSADEFAAKWQEKPVEAFQALLKGIQTSTDEGGNLSLLLDNLGITSIRQLDSMKRLVNSGDLLVDTVELANKGWKENTALGEEVANRNESLASKFEILKNRVTAVADDIGGPLADALLDAIDAAEPLFKAIESGAKAFSAMSKEEQLAIIKNVGMVAALGPVLSVVGRLTSGVGGAVKAFGDFGDFLGGFGKEAKVANAAIQGTEKAMGAATTAASGLKGGLIGLGAAVAAIGLAVAIKAWQDYQHELELTRKGEMSLEEARSIATGSLGDYATAAGETTQKIRDMREEQAKNVDDLINSMKSLNTDNSAVQAYLDTILELQGKTGLTREEQDKLNTAVERYNELTGDNLEILDKENGKLSESTDALLRNRDAWIKNRSVKVFEEKYDQAMHQKIEAEETLEQASKNRAAAEAEAARLREEQAKADSRLWDSYDQQIRIAEARAEEERKNEREAILLRDQAIKKMGEYEQAITDQNKAYDEQISTLDRTKGAIYSYGEETAKTLADTGISVDDLTGKLVNSGLKAEWMEGVSDKAFTEMWLSCNGNVDLMVHKLQTYNELPIHAKTAVINGDVDDVKRKVDELQRMKLKPITQKFVAELDTGQMRTFGNTNIQWRQQAAGGLFKNADILNSIPKHADGFIGDRPMLTSAGWAFEAGAEALIPLDNKQKVAPFAKAVASFMPSGGDTYLVIDGAVVNSNPQIKAAFLDLFEDIYRMGGMNRG